MARLEERLDSDLTALVHMVDDALTLAHHTAYVDCDERLRKGALPRLESALDTAETLRTVWYQGRGLAEAPASRWAAPQLESERINSHVGKLALDDPDALAVAGLEQAEHDRVLQLDRWLNACRKPLGRCRTLLDLGAFADIPDDLREVQMYAEPASMAAVQLARYWFELRKAR